ncbi:PAS domain S-box/diguanylate cyclase (GGDEF)domain-containing protein [Striga asiatica]|uniref:PAS domain S-box/diguanylate cyclase (GGDEF)domain-containing protein n=1 Tax=Striga asiatica TaxID=4170 RepID=A0A5A7Q041_STRAF|nr:PAS domain S-box/diguanylate cyclase (GGDEF)domain-containing protein [Striga asiatica]
MSFLVQPIAEKNVDAFEGVSIHGTVMCGSPFAEQLPDLADRYLAHSSVATLLSSKSSCVATPSQPFRASLTGLRLGSQSNLVLRGSAQESKHFLLARSDLEIQTVRLFIALAASQCRLYSHRLGSVTKYREKKSLRLTKDRKSTLSTDAGKVVEKGTCDQFFLLSNRSIACHVALSIEEEGICSSLKSFLPIDRIVKLECLPF